MKKNPLYLFFAFSLITGLVFTACDEDDGDEGSASYTLSGDVPDGSHKASSVKYVTAELLEGDGSSDDDWYILADAYTSNNSFTLKLPALEASHLYKYSEEFPSSSSFTISNTGAKLATVYGTGAYDANKSFIDWICYERVSFDSKVVNWTSGYMIYVDSDLSISGSTTGYNDEDDDFEWNIDCTFKKGWNRYYIDYEYDKTSADLLVVTETTASQSNMDWVYDDDISLLLDAAFGSSLKIAKTEKKAFKIADGRKK